MFHTYIIYRFVLRFSLGKSSIYLHSSCSWRQRQLKDPISAFSFKSKKTLFSATAKKASFGLEKLIICFPVRLCVRDKLRAEVQTFWKTHNFLPSSRRNANKFSNWVAFTAGWFFLSKKGIWIDDMPCYGPNSLS